jgi:phenylpyruvate tautomerase PptA (4-oxalocrotonate tautomerase family)
MLGRGSTLMPFTRITLRQGYSDEQIMQISDILQKCLEKEFAVPSHDRFQVFETLAASQRVFDYHYKSGGRSDDFIQFHVIAGKPRSFEQKKNLCRTLCEQLHTALNINPNDVMVMIQFNTADEWSFSNGQLLSEEEL